MRRFLSLPLFLGLAACAGTRSAPEGAAFAFVDDPAAGVLLLREDGAPVLAYRYGDQLAPNVPADRTRSSYVHPIHGLDGEVLTDDFPADHQHHRGLSLMWPRMRVGEQGLELWHIRGLRSLFRGWVTRATTPAAALLEVENAWVMDGGPEAAREEVAYLVHRAAASGRAIDVRYRITAGSRPVALQGQVDKGYGGLNLRFAPREETVITTEAGVAADADLTRFAWADLSARFGGRAESAGIAIFVAPAHPGFPPGWTLRHYGDLNVAWPGLAEVVLAPGEEVVLRYRLWVHRGGVEAGEVVAAWEAFLAELRAGDDGFAVSNR
ncbi:MAG: DUF6807 family protein [Planctomycetota bacterium]